MAIAEFVVEVRGVGKPDYSKEVSSARERRGLRLAYKQTLEIFGLVFSAIPSPFAWVKLPLDIGASEHYVDNSTGLALPYTVLEGYTLTLIAAGGGFTNDALATVFFDGYLAMSGGIMAGGQSDYENRIVGISTATLDPTGATSHTLDIQITNKGGGALEGGIEWTGILEEVGSLPLPGTKVLRCKWCGHEETVPVEQTSLICPECGKLTMVYSLRHFRETP